MNNNCPVPNTGPCSIGMNSSSYANGAFYMDDQDTFVARTSPPSSPSDEQDSGDIVKSLDLEPVLDDATNENLFLEELNNGRKNIYDILSQRNAYDVLPDSQKWPVFNINFPLDLVFQSLRRQEMVEGMIWNSRTGMYEGVITSSDLLICLNRQYALYQEAVNAAMKSGNTMQPIQFPRVLEYDIEHYRNLIDPNSKRLAYGIPNNSLFQILKLMFDCHVHRIPIIDRAQEGNLIGVINYLDILHDLVSLYPDQLFNYNYSIRELGIGTYDNVWNVREDTPLHDVLQIMETKLISSIPVVDHEDNLIGVFQRTDLIKLDFKDMSIFDCPINTFVSSFQPFSSKLIINANESLSRLFFTFAQYNTTSLICVNDENKPCGIASIVDLFFFFLKGDFALPAHPSAPPSVREASSMSQSYLGLFSPGTISASGSVADLSVGDFCMNYPETVVQPRTSRANREEMEMDTYDEELERMRGHVRTESGHRERSEMDGGDDRFVTKKRMVE
ncbi:hypothetical protein WA577_001952 [Blastocystis sp. JDR]